MGRRLRSRDHLLSDAVKAPLLSTSTMSQKDATDSDVPSSKNGPPLRRESDKGIAWLHSPTFSLSINYFFSVRGGESIHLYLWIMKDLSWTQEWFYQAWVFGTLALVWAVYLLAHAVYEGATNEIFTRVAVTFWIFGNWWWITGEVHDWNYPDDPPIYDERTAQASYILDAGLCWLGVFYLIVKPLRLLGADDPEMLRRYDGTGLQTRFSFLFPTWREYENAHILFWMAKVRPSILYRPCFTPVSLSYYSSISPVSRTVLGPTTSLQCGSSLLFRQWVWPTISFGCRSFVNICSWTTRITFPF